MSGNMGNLGAVHHARGLLMALALGLMLACGTAYASEPSSPAPAPTTQDAANQADSDYDFNIAPHVGDLLFDGGIAFLIIVMGAFFAIGFLDSKDKGGE